VKTKDFNADYYDESYYTYGRPYIDQDGTFKSFADPGEGDFTGFVAALAKTISFKTVFDVGCGKGGFVNYLRRCGFDAWGCDYSEYAINNPLGLAKDHIQRADAVNLQVVSG
jgi:SAM-dependent methyltransferase